MFQWNDSLCINVEEIDNQHKELVQIINNLADSMAEGKGKNRLGMIIRELIDYTILHFHTEERIFRMIGYPDAKNHKKEHAAFVTKVSDFQTKFEKGNLGLSVEVLNYLCDWLRNHIKINDKKIGEYIANYHFKH